MFRDDSIPRNVDFQEHAHEQSLFDNWGRKHNYLRIAVTDRCNLRCSYCVPTGGVKFRPNEKLLSADEIIRLAGIFTANGITKIRLTGGEPLMRNDIIEIVRALDALEKRPILAMTTNATRLEGKAEALKQAGLNALNISLDTLRAERFEKITSRSYFHSVLAGLNQAIACGFDKIKLNVVVMAGVNDDEILDFVELAQDTGINVRFIEYMPFKDNRWRSDLVLPYKLMKERIESRFTLTAMNSEPGAVAKDYKIEGREGGSSVSFITAMTDSFCGTCNRLRITSDGAIKSCLFYPAELNLRDVMRQGAGDKEILKLIRKSLLMKPEKAPPASDIEAGRNRTMIDIGG